MCQNNQDEGLLSSARSSHQNVNWLFVVGDVIPTPQHHGIRDFRFLSPAIVLINNLPIAPQLQSPGEPFKHFSATTILTRRFCVQLQTVKSTPTHSGVNFHPITWMSSDSLRSGVFPEINALQTSLHRDNLDEPHIWNDCVEGASPRGHARRRESWVEQHPRDQPGPWQI